MLALDHIAIATTDLVAGTAEIERALGVPLEPGGRHERYGTHNTLLGLGSLYLEVIAADPGASPGRPRWFGLDDFKGDTRPANWICRTDDLDAALAEAPEGVGEKQHLTRGDLAWDITVPADGSLPMAGGWPTMIQWGPGIASPAAGLPDRGCRLTGWEVLHPDAEWLRANVPLNDARVAFVPSETIGFRATISTPSGPVVL